MWWSAARSREVVKEYYRLKELRRRGNVQSDALSVFLDEWESIHKGITGTLSVSIAHNDLSDSILLEYTDNNGLHIAAIGNKGELVCLTTEIQQNKSGENLLRNIIRASLQDVLEKMSQPQEVVKLSTNMVSSLRKLKASLKIT